MLVRHHDLAGLDVPLELCADGVQRAGFRGEHDVPVFQSAHAQRAEPVGVPGGDELTGGGKHQRVSSLNAVHGGVDRLLDGGLAQPLLHEDVGDDLRVGGGLKNGAFRLQLLAQFVGVGEIAVVSQSHAALMVIDQNGLNIALVVAAGGAVPHMAYGNVALSQRRETLRREHVAHQSYVPIGGEHPVVVHHNAAALLSPVL